MVNVAVLLPVTVVLVLTLAKSEPSTENCHWYESLAVPVAVILKTAGLPATTFTFTGCTVTVGFTGVAAAFARTGMKAANAAIKKLKRKLEWNARISLKE